MSEFVDNLDLRILDALQQDGALTNQALSEKVALSASQCSRRRQRLEEIGIIRRYRADLDPERLGFGILVYVSVSLSRHDPQNSQRFRDLVAITQEVQEAHVLTGTADYILKVRVRDLKALSALVNDVLLPNEAVSQVRSNIVMETLKTGDRLPIRP